MARRRYYRRGYRRSKASMVWVPYSRVDDFTLTSNTYCREDWPAFKPGMTSGTSGDTEHFDQDVILERIRGTIVHNGTGGVTNDNLFPFWSALLIAPANLLDKASGDELPDLRYNEDGDNYPFFDSSVCDVGSSSANVPTAHVIDSKAKRRINVGDALKFFFGAMAPSFSGSAKIQLALNVRLLFRLKV